MSQTLFFITWFTQDMKDDKKLNKKHIKIQMTLPSLKTYAFDEGCTKCIQRCIDSLLQTVKLIK